MFARHGRSTGSRGAGGGEQPLPAAQQDLLQPACPVMAGTQQRQEPHQGRGPVAGGLQARLGGACQAAF